MPFFKPAIFSLIGLLSCSGFAVAENATPDPFAANIGVYPPDNSNPPPFDGPYKFRKLSHDYPQAAPAHSWLDIKPKGPITVENAAAYMEKLKAYVEPSLRKMIEAPAEWDPAANGWYDMPWEGFYPDPKGGSPDYEKGRDAVLGSFTGQIILQSSEGGGLTADTQNHTIIYYDAMAGATLGEIWKDVGHPKLDATSFKEGSIEVKAGGVAATPKEWPIVDGAAVWRVYRPPVAEAIAHARGQSSAPYTMAVQDLRVMQFDIIVKDTDAAPETGWVFTTFVFDRDAPKGSGPWDQLVPLGATWGNDPEFDMSYDGAPPSGQSFKQFWRNPKAPLYGMTTLGWGGRMSGPIDIAERHKIITVEDVKPGDLVGKSDAFCDDPSIKHKDVAGSMHVSGCFSCHGTAQSTYAGPRLYPSPFPFLSGLPSDGEPFCLYTPGAKQWAEWFQNRSGSEPMQAPKMRAKAAMPMAEGNARLPYARYLNPERGPVPMAIAREVFDAPVRGLDYDMLLMFAIGNAQFYTQGVTFLPDRIPAH